MRIEELIANLDVELMRGSQDLVIRDIVDDSRDASPGCMFIARAGIEHDGRAFIADAVEAGAAAVVCDDISLVPLYAAALVAHDVAAIGACLAERFFGSPSRQLRLVGVTGTNGKTTTAHLVHQIANHAGIRCGLLSTVQIDDGSEILPADLTTPGSIRLSRLLRRMVDHGCRACVMEVSSHALDQGRTAGVTFAAAVFTNLSGDHLDYHGTMEAYGEAKRRLFASLSTTARAIVNVDDPAAGRMLAQCRASALRCTVVDEGRGGAADEHTCTATILEQSLRGTLAVFEGPWGTLETTVRLAGRFNVSNALQAIAAAHALGLDATQLQRGLEQAAAPPGRLDAVHDASDDIAVFVDYAHTDDALSKAVGALRPLVPDDGRLVALFGCGGDRDRGKRPRMAEVACRHADRIVITSDNPRTEDPQEIIDEIVAGIPVPCAPAVHTDPDRRAAIESTVATARTGDVILIAGKGHETYQIIGTQKSDFDDRTIARQALAHRRAANIGRSANFFRPGNIQLATGGRWLREPGESCHIRGVAIDSRDDLTGRAFIAIKGDRHDGHEYLADAATAGAELVIVEQDIAVDSLPEHTGVLRVDDTCEALQHLATAYRRRLTNATVIAITGSVGKTTTKGILDAVLGQSRQGTAAPRSYNNHLGVPLTILSADPADEYIIVELGTSAPGEISALAMIAAPHVAVITAVGRSHLEGLGSIDGVAREKVSLLEHLQEDGVAILPADAESLRSVARPDAAITTFGLAVDADLRLTDRQLIDGEHIIEVNRTVQYHLAVPGAHNALNALAVIAVARQLGVHEDDIRAGLAAASLPAMRMTECKLPGRTIVFNDSYNANPESMRASIQAFIEHAPPAARRVFVLGDMLELGADGPALHRELGSFIVEMISRGDLHEIILVGELSLHTADAIDRLTNRITPRWIESLDDEASRMLVQSLFRTGDAILLKGSRAMALERLLDDIEIAVTSSAPSETRCVTAVEHSLQG